MTKRYEKYKDSGIAWIGEIPEHWEVCKIKHIILLLTDYDANGSFADIAANTNINNGNPYAWMVRATDLENKRYGIVEGNNYCDIETFRFLKKSFLKSNDILIAKRGEIGKVYMVPDYESPMTLAPNTYLLKTKINICNRYLFYYLKSDIGKELLKQNNKSTAIGALYKNDVKDMPCFLCDMPTQEQIAKYLDWKCGEVDRIVEVRERQIKLLAELRTSVISRAVTRGLNPNAPLKDSGIEWIGQIPEHWEVFPIKHLCRNEKYSIKTGPFGTQLKGDDLQESGDVRVYNQKNVIYGCFDDVRFYVSNQKAERLKSFYTQPNDFLITSRGTIGRAAIIPNDFEMGILHPCLIALRLSKYKVLDKWLLYFVNDTDCFKTGIQLASNATTIEVIYTETLKNTPVAIPSIPEQQQIADYLDKKTTEIDNTINKFKAQIDKLKEYRQALITEVVTGKIDVRGIEIPTPKSN